MPVNLEHNARTDLKGLTNAEIDKSDYIALECLNINKKQIEKTRMTYKKMKAVYYREPGVDGGCLLVSKDGTVLFSASIVGKRNHLQAFEAGLRSDVNQLIHRKKRIEENQN